MKKPPYIKLYVKDFAFDTASMTNEELGAYMRRFLASYKSGKVSKENEHESLFIELASSFCGYVAVCERNSKNRLKSMDNKNDSSTSGQRLDDQKTTTLVNQEPRTKNQEPIKKEYKPDLENQAVEIYNAHAEKSGLAKVAKLTSARKSKLISRLKDCGGIQGWEEAVTRMCSNPFMLGANDRGWKADFDFLVTESKFTKIMEGSYQNGKAGTAEYNKQRLQEWVDGR